MISRNWSRTSITLALALAILSTYSMVALAAPQQGPTGDLSVVGEVTVNGTSAISGATVFSDSTVTTAKGSSAVVSLGKLGRVEVLPESIVKSASARLADGHARSLPRPRLVVFGRQRVSPKDVSAVADSAHRTSHG